MTVWDGDRDVESDMHLSSDNASMHSDGFSENNDSGRERNWRKEKLWNNLFTTSN